MHTDINLCIYVNMYIYIHISKYASSPCLLDGNKDEGEAVEGMLVVQGGRHHCGALHSVFDEVTSCRPVNFTDSKTQPFHEGSPSPWQQRSPPLSRGRRPPLRRR